MTPAVGTLNRRKSLGTVRRHLRAAHAVARAKLDNPGDADDVCQDAFIKALERIDDCRNPDGFRAWLLTIVRNTPTTPGTTSA